MHKEFEKTGIIYNPEIKEAKGIALLIKEKIENSKVFSLDEPLFDIDLAIVIGGDGSFLKTSRAVNLPNFMPAIFLNFIFEVVSLAKHPHDFVRPFVRFELNTSVSFPQSHKHFHFELPTYSTAINFPKR